MDNFHFQPQPAEGSLRFYIAGSCQSHVFACASGECVLLSDQCNGVKDCEDGSDELNCDWEGRPTYPVVLYQRSKTNFPSALKETTNLISS